MKRERSFFSIALGGFVLCVSIFVVGILCLLPALRGTEAGEDDGIPTPALVGSLYQASTIPAGLTPHLHYQTDTTLPEGTVLSQSPTAGVLARVGSALDLTISTQLAPVRLPDVVGRGGADATAALAALGLTARVVREVREDLPDGTVIATYPSAGVQVFPQEQVTLVCGANTTVIVPFVVGLSLDDAIFKLESAGLAQGKITYIPHAVTSGTVLGQSVQGRAQAGALVDLVVAK